MSSRQTKSGKPKALGGTRLSSNRRHIEADAHWLMIARRRAEQDEKRPTEDRAEIGRSLAEAVRLMMGEPLTRESREYSPVDQVGDSRRGRPLSQGGDAIMGDSRRIMLALERTRARRDLDKRARDSIVVFLKKAWALILNGERKEGKAKDVSKKVLDGWAPDDHKRGLDRVLGRDELRGRGREKRRAARGG